MKKIILLLAVCLILFSAFTAINPGSSITGTVEPPDAVNKVMAVGSDTVTAVPLNGRFTLTLKPGNWTLIVIAVSPYKDYSQPVLVVDGAPNDVGVIRLQK